MQEVALHALQRDRLRAGGARRAASRSTSSRPGSPSSSTATTTSSRRSPSSAPCGGCGPRSCASASAPTEARSQTIRFHTQTGGVTLQAQQPEVNIIRVALQGFAAVCGGTQSLHTNGFDEALGAADRALGADRAAHPAGARPRVGRRRHGRPVRRLLLHRVAHRRDRGARLGADGRRSSSSAARSRRSTSSSARSRSRPPPTTSATAAARTSSSASTSTSPTQVDDVEILRVDPESERRQVERLAKFKAARDQAAVEAPARGAPRGRRRARATCSTRSRTRCATDASIGEVCGAMREVFGEYKGGAFF